MKKYENFCKALENLQDIYQYDEPYNNVILSGLVALYEICFEQGYERGYGLGGCKRSRNRFA